MKKLVLTLFLALNIALANPQKNPQKLKLTAKQIEFLNAKEGERVIFAKGEVEAKTADYKLCAGEIKVNEKEDELSANGDVVLTSVLDGAEFRTSSATSNKDLTKVSLGEFYFEKDRIFGDGKGGKKEGEVISIEEIRVSTCSRGKNGVAEWRIKSKNAKYDVEKDEIVAKNVIFYAFDVPVFWFPYFTIKPKRTHGFLAPKAEYSRNQTSLKTPYFISFDEKKHYFVFSPEFVAGKKKQENLSKVNNYEISYEYDGILVDYKIAPSAFTKSDLTGIAQEEKADRYHFFTNINLSYSNGNYGANYHKISDRFFLKDYRGSFENYIKNNLFFNYFAKDNKQSLTLETAKFIPIAFKKENNLAKLDFYGNHTLEEKFTGFTGLKFYNNVNVMKFSREEGTYHSRFSDSLGINKNFRLGRLESEVIPEVRYDLYRKNYTAENGLLQNNENSTSYRIVPSLFIGNKMPFYFEKKNSKDFLIKLEPQFNFKANLQKLNDKDVLLEDSGTIFLNSQNITSKNSTFGYDLLDEGMLFTFGSKALIKHNPSSSSFEIFLAQRAKRLDGEVDFSQYFVKTEMGLYGIFTANSDFILTKENEIDYAVSELSLKLWKLRFGFGKTFVNKNFTKRASNTNENIYGLNFQITEIWKFNAKIIENLNFITKNNDVKRQVVLSSYSLEAKTDCINFEIGLKRERRTISDLESKYSLFASIGLIGI